MHPQTEHMYTTRSVSPKTGTKSRQADHRSARRAVPSIQDLSKPCIRPISHHGNVEANLVPWHMDEFYLPQTNSTANPSETIFTEHYDTGHPMEDSFQEFIAFFGEKLIQETGAKEWMEQALEYHFSKKMEELISSFLEEFAVKMMWSHFNPRDLELLVRKKLNPSPEKSWVLLDDTASLIRHYRKNIADYFCINSIAGSTTAVSLIGNTVPSDEVDPLLRWYMSFEASKFDQKNFRRTGDFVPEENEETEKPVTTEDAETFNEFDFVKETLMSGEGFQRLASELRPNLQETDRCKMGSISQKVMFAVTSFGTQGAIESFTFLIKWKLLHFMRSQYGGIIPISTVVVLIGSSLHAQATTCGEYVRRTWPTVGPVLLDILDRTLSSKAKRYSESYPGMSLKTYDVSEPIIIHLQFLMVTLSSCHWM